MGWFYDYCNSWGCFDNFVNSNCDSFYRNNLSLRNGGLWKVGGCDTESEAVRDIVDSLNFTWILKMKL